MSFNIFMLVILLSLLLRFVASSRESISRMQTIDDFEDFEAESSTNSLINGSRVESSTYSKHSIVSTSYNMRTNFLYSDDEYFSSLSSKLSSPHHYKDALPKSQIKDTGGMLTSVKKQFRLFRTFTYKGVGFTIAKSVLNWNACSIGIKVPITSMFPEYDRIVHLPRIGATFSCSYPFNFKVSFTFALPLHITLYGLAQMIKSINLASSDVIIKAIKKPKPSDSIRRVGFTYTMRYSNRDGMKSSFGPLVHYIPGKVITDILLQLIFSFPALLLTLLNVLVNIDGLAAPEKVSVLPPRRLDATFPLNGTNGCDKIHDGSQYFDCSTTSISRHEFLKFAQILFYNNSSFLLLTIALTAGVASQRSSLNPQATLCSSLSPQCISHNVDTNSRGDDKQSADFQHSFQLFLLKFSRSCILFPRRGFNYWKAKLLDWANSKTIGVLCTLGLLKSHSEFSYGSGIQLDLQPFFQAIEFPRSLKLLISNHITPLLQSIVF